MSKESRLILMTVVSVTQTGSISMQAVNGMSETVYQMNNASGTLFPNHIPPDLARTLIGRMAWIGEDFSGKTFIAQWVPLPEMPSKGGAA